MAILQKFNILSRNILKYLPRNGVIPQDFKQMQRRSLWGSVDIAFNRVDADRLKQVGADRLCAEWLMKNGGAIRTAEEPQSIHRDYNSLPPEDDHFHIKVVDASGSSIMKIGFEHFIGCHSIDTVILNQCNHLEDDSLKGLIHLKNTLKELQVSACDNISDEGLMDLGELSKLELLKIFEMRYVKDLNKVKQHLVKKLPKCVMDMH